MPVGDYPTNLILSILAVVCEGGASPSSTPQGHEGLVLHHMTPKIARPTCYTLFRSGTLDLAVLLLFLYGRRQPASS